MFLHPIKIGGSHSDRHLLFPDLFYCDAIISLRIDCILHSLNRIVAEVLQDLFEYRHGLSACKLHSLTVVVCVEYIVSAVHIPEDDISKLFEPFYRVEQSRNRQTGGSGLGLYIVKTIINLHNAEISVQNTDDGVAIKVIF